MEKITLSESKQSSRSSRLRTKLFNFLAFVDILLLTYTTAESTYRSRHQPSSALAVALWLVAGLIAISGFYLMFFFSEADVVDTGGINYSTVVNEELPPNKKV